MYKNIMRISNHYRVRNIRWYMTMVYALAFSALRDLDLWQPSRSWIAFFFSFFCFFSFFVSFFFLFFIFFESERWSTILNYIFSCACNLFLFLYKTQISSEIKSTRNLMFSFPFFFSFFCNFIYKNEKLVHLRNIYIFYCTCKTLYKKNRREREREKKNINKLISMITFITFDNWFEQK